jgi:hypothetical protein
LTDESKLKNNVWILLWIIWWKCWRRWQKQNNSKIDYNDNNKVAKTISDTPQVQDEEEDIKATESYNSSSKNNNKESTTENNTDNDNSTDNNNSNNNNNHHHNNNKEANEWSDSDDDSDDECDKNKRIIFSHGRYLTHSKHNTLDEFASDFQYQPYFDHYLMPMTVMRNSAKIFTSLEDDLMSNFKVMTRIYLDLKVRARNDSVDTKSSEKEVTDKKVKHGWNPGCLMQRYDPTADYPNINKVEDDSGDDLKKNDTLKNDDSASE